MSVLKVHFRLICKWDLYTVRECHTPDICLLSAWVTQIKLFYGSGLVPDFWHAACVSLFPSPMCQRVFVSFFVKAQNVKLKGAHVPKRKIYNPLMRGHQPKVFENSEKCNSIFWILLLIAARCFYDSVFVVPDLWLAVCASWFWSLMLLGTVLLLENHSGRLVLGCLQFFCCPQTFPVTLIVKEKRKPGRLLRQINRLY